MVTAVETPTRRQLAALVGNDQELIILFERLFQQAGTTAPTEAADVDADLTQAQADIITNANNITFNYVATENNAVDIATNVAGIAANLASITAIQTAIAGLSSGELVFVASVADFPDPVAGVISLVSGVAYYIVGDVDLAGDRLSCSGPVTILGASPETSTLKSTGLVSGTALITSTDTLTLKSVALTAETVFDLNGTGAEGLDWFGVNLIDCPEIGTIQNYSNLIVNTMGILNSAGWTFDGTIGTIGFTDTIFEGSAAATIIMIPATAAITRRFRIRYSAFVTLSGETSLDVSASASLPVEGYILDHCNFAGGGTYITGVQHDDTEALFEANVGISNSTNVAFYTMQGNATATTIAAIATPVKVAGTTTASSITQGFDTATTNRAEYVREVARTFRVTATVTVSGATNKEVGVFIAKNGTVDTTTRGGGSTGSGGRADGVVSQGVFDMSDTDYLEVWIENADSTDNLTVDDLNFIAQAM